MFHSYMYKSCIAHLIKTLHGYFVRPSKPITLTKEEHYFVLKKEFGFLAVLVNTIPDDVFQTSSFLLKISEKQVALVPSLLDEFSLLFLTSSRILCTGFMNQIRILLNDLHHTL